MTGIQQDSARSGRLTASAIQACGTTAAEIYRSANVRLHFKRALSGEQLYALANLYPFRISPRLPAFAGGKYGGGTGVVRSTNLYWDARQSPSAGFCHCMTMAVGLKHGVTYRASAAHGTSGLLLTNGELMTYDYRTLTDEALGMTVYQSLGVRPTLLDAEGHAKEKFRSAGD